MNSEKPSDPKKDEKDILRPHQFDGIQEYENQLPRWWVLMFYLSIVFAAAYFVFYEFGAGVSLYDRYLSDHESEIDLKRVEASKVKPLSEEELLSLSNKPEIVKLGADQFKAKCVSCHTEDGGGSVGPNLTDDYWLHGNQLTDMVKVITEGVPAKGMPTWGALMNASEIQAAAVYVRSLYGTKPKNPKKPEGEFLKAH